VARWLAPVDSRRLISANIACFGRRAAAGAGAGPLGPTRPGPEPGRPGPCPGPAAVFNPDDRQAINLDRLQ